MLNDRPLVVSWGGGVNSTALLIGYKDLGVEVDLILFADTGGEKPETYQFKDIFSAWLVSQGMQPIIIVQNDGMYGTLENNCLQKNMLPSIAYGYKSCSDKYKARPQNKFTNRWEPARECWRRGQLVYKAIGYDAAETRRNKVISDAKFEYIAPLIEWRWYREDCIAAIEKERLPVPIKSACFFCPSSRKQEVVWLRDTHPDLYARAIAMERGANLTTVRGLGRSYSWETFAGPETVEMPCMCFDGSED